MSESKAFDPRQHMSEMTRKAKRPDGTWREVKTEYLEVRWRLVWLRAVDPKANITTTIHEANDKYAIVHCSIGLTDGGYGSGVGMCFRDKWERHLEKAETTALGRALATLGFGTQFCGDEFDEDGAIADSPVDQVQRQPPSREPMPQNAAVPHTTPAATGDGISDAQRRALFAIGKAIGLDSDTAIDVEIAKMFPGERISTISKAAASAVIHALDERRQKTTAQMSGMPAIERRRE